MDEATMGVLRWYAIEEFGLTGTDVFRLDMALAELRVACLLRRRAEGVLGSGGKRATSEYERLMATAGKGMQLFASEMAELSDRREMIRGLPSMEGQAPPLIESVPEPRPLARGRRITEA